ncbi:MAG TPA: tetraacyldisaccharide 4'-kinase [Candidatus Hydrogenedentes bacterium]|nr:tetraacyldisaccharide 4'-kinase [Candidatus Hydrogenedentota bacterium]HOV75993.1 tetraacyldisaccharide 4'-kinase [Candidatus Hydrogenedentota bacterium]HPC18134.1 tetraacyldisaccharide 4'-kinase [Candidatus Hydrogenedentota bacterium]HRT21720.1 tetraacyldisaccharide 4'-kinase [Candidatus Hydrogenedentota bacterium]HRT66786.1 tetraacyldisaccharide 4'-kinase [Candidatus Hydrogenedentota bacterium]
MNAVLYGLAERIRRNEAIPLPVAALLTAATPIVRAGMWLRRRRRIVHVDANVISVGNLTAGGTGKTPLVVERARRELAQGRKVAVLTRGYGSAPVTNPVAADENGPDDPFALMGDEAALLIQKIPGIVVVKCVDRVAAANAAVERHGCDTLILEDGFQYVRLARNEDIVVIDARNPFGNGRLIPRGILREPMAALRRATHVVVTRCDQASNLESLCAQIRTICPNIPVRTTRHAPAHCRRVGDGKTFPLDMLREGPIRAACAIGAPEAFFDTLASLGATVTERLAFPDHAGIPESALDGPLPVVVTEKDAVRMRRAPDHVFALSIELEDWPLS